MMNQGGRRIDDAFIKGILKMWPLIVAFISVVSIVTTIKNEVDSHELRITKLENALIGVGKNTDRLVDELLEKK